MTYYSNLQLPATNRLIGVTTLSTTLKALHDDLDLPLTFKDAFFNRVGRKMKLRLFGKMTTAATPGNLTISVLFGDGSDNDGTVLASSAALALTPSQTDLSFLIETDIVCITTGATGTLLCTGYARFNNAVVAASLQPVLIPASASAVSGALDLTSTNAIPSVQAMRSGVTVETMTVMDLDGIFSSGGQHS
jgi:hypothetical protein